jgi:hypothetical protein
MYSPSMRDKAFLASLLTLVLHLAAPLMLQATALAPGDAAAIAAPRCVDGGACVPRVSASEDLCRLVSGSEARDPASRRTASRRPPHRVSRLRTQPPAHRAGYSARHAGMHRPAADDDRPA